MGKGPALVGGVVLAVLGLLTWEAIALGVSFTALFIASIALLRSGTRDREVAAWRAAQHERAEQLGEALRADLQGD